MRGDVRQLQIVYERQGFNGAPYMEGGNGDWDGYDQNGNGYDNYDSYDEVLTLCGNEIPRPLL